MINQVMRGAETEMLVASKLIQKGANISFPISHHNEYDMIADINNHLIKIQVKRAFIINSHGKEYLAIGTKRQMTRKSSVSRIRTKEYSDYGYDFLIACDVENQDFWIIPREYTIKYKSQIYLTTEHTIQFKNKWSVIGMIE